MRAIGSHEGRDLDAIDHRILACHGVRLGADRIDAGIGAAPLRELLDALVDILFHKIERDGARLHGEGQSLGYRVDGDHPFGAQQKCALDGKLADWSAAPDGDCLAAFEVAKFRGHIAGRENIREKQDLFVREPLRAL